MSKKSLHPDSGSTETGIQLVFLLALVVIFIYIFYPQPKAEPKVLVVSKPEIYLVVLNGCGVVNLAEEVSSRLLNMGFNVMKWGNIENMNSIHQKTLLVIRQNSENQDVKLAYIKEKTGISEKIIAYKENSLTEFELVLGKDYINYFKK